VKSTVQDAGRLAWSADAEGVAVQVTRCQAYRIVFADHATAATPALERLLAQASAARVTLLVDRRLPSRPVDRVRAGLEDWGAECDVVPVSGDEAGKRLATAAGVWAHLERTLFKRRDLLVGVGGGVVCDLTGFVAATFMRGVPYALVPTSLIAQIDGAIGGKVGVNSAEAKNLLGGFYHPSLVVVARDLLDSLPPRELACGMAEATKVAVIASARLFDELERLGRAWQATGPTPPPLPLLRRCVEVKLRLLAPDPFETTCLDRELNLGHTVGHALEAATGFATYRHGEAVATGMAVAANLAVRLGRCAPATRRRLLDHLRRCGLPTTVPASQAAAVLGALDRIRAVRGGLLRMVIPCEIGATACIGEVDAEALRAAMTATDRATTAEPAGTPSRPSRFAEAGHG